MHVNHFRVTGNCIDIATVYNMNHSEYSRSHDHLTPSKSDRGQCGENAG